MYLQVPLFQTKQFSLELIRPGNERFCVRPVYLWRNRRGWNYWGSSTISWFAMRLSNGGGGEIRTLETVAGLAVFKTTGINHYPTPPKYDYRFRCLVLLLQSTFVYLPLAQDSHFYYSLFWVKNPNLLLVGHAGLELSTPVLSHYSLADKMAQCPIRTYLR